MTVASPSLITSLQGSMPKADPLDSIREKAWQRLIDLGLPTPKTEAFKYVQMQGFNQSRFELATLQHINEEKIVSATESLKGQNYLLFYNGYFLPRYSSLDSIDSKVIIKPLNDAFSSYGVFIDNVLKQWLAKETDPLSLLGLAKHSQGAFIYVPPKLALSSPIHVVEVFDANHNELSAPVVMVSCARQSQLKLLSHIAADQEASGAQISNYFFNLDAAAIVRHQQASVSLAFQSFENVRVTQKQSSQFKRSACAIESFKSRSSVRVQLLEEQAETEIMSLATLRQKQQNHSHILVEHLAPGCYSRQLVKHLLDESSQASFDGEIYVTSEAQQTNAYQLNQNCLLSDQSKCYSKPNLEIFADDVKASHGSTTGYIDRQQLFYLQSRGLTKKQAQKILLHAFCYEIASSLDSAVLEPLVQRSLKRYFEA